MSSSEPFSVALFSVYASVLAFVACAISSFTKCKTLQLITQKHDAMLKTLHVTSRKHEATNLFVKRVVQDYQSMLNAVKTDVELIKTDNAPLASSVKMLKADNALLRAENKILRTDVTFLKAENVSRTTEIASLCKDTTFLIRTVFWSSSQSALHLAAQILHLHLDMRKPKPRKNDAHAFQNLLFRIYAFQNLLLERVFNADTVADKAILSADFDRLVGGCVAHPHGAAFIEAESRHLVQILDHFSNDGHQVSLMESVALLVLRHCAEIV
jgi:hypothetical protein